MVQGILINRLSTGLTRVDAGHVDSLYLLLILLNCPELVHLSFIIHFIGEIIYSRVSKLFEDLTC